jgi:hypothetical protein
MITKLTLSIERRVIRRAKSYVRKEKTSLSKVVESYLNELTRPQEKPRHISPLVKSLSGAAKLPPNFDLKKEYTKYLKRKYG